MREEELAVLVTKHDKHIDSMAQSIEHLAGAVGITNRKLDDVIEVMGQQNILMEKFHNLEENLKESFGRVHKRTQKIEDICNNEGCSALKLSNKDIKSLEKRLTKSESNATWFIRIVFGFIVIGVLGSVITFGIRG